MPTVVNFVTLIICDLFGSILQMETYSSFKLESVTDKLESCPTQAKRFPDGENFTSCTQPPKKIHEFKDIKHGNIFFIEDSPPPSVYYA
uniref:Uncharacterized protein n=1 Tax=Romanomermis culicivorax TaxID=13658 RepID=A0A915J9Z7_ROMCU